MINILHLSQPHRADQAPGPQVSHNSHPIVPTSTQSSDLKYIINRNCKLAICSSLRTMFVQTHSNQ